MVRNAFHRLEQLETRAKQVAATHPPQHTICFIEPVNKRVASALTQENGKQVWTHFDLPRNRAEFKPIVLAAEGAARIASDIVS